METRTRVKLIICNKIQTEREQLLIKSFIHFYTGSTLKCRNALGFNFTALTHLCFSVALYMYILALVFSFCFKKVMEKFS